MAGINRLGKPPPKPGTLRPPDPNKYRTLDMFSHDVEGDAEYHRMLQDIEDLQQQQGWLFGKGAFDKGDLMYLREQAQKQRYAEMELRETEIQQFATMKAKMERKEKTKPLMGGMKRKGGRSMQTKILESMVKIKPKEGTKQKRRKKKSTEGLRQKEAGKKPSEVEKQEEAGKKPSEVEKQEDAGKKPSEVEGLKHEEGVS